MKDQQWNQTTLRRLGLPVVLGTVMFLSGCKTDLTDAAYVERAKEYQESGDLRSSTIELKNALRKNPENLEARWLLGRIYVEMGNGAAAEKELQRAKELGLDRMGWLVPLAQAYLLQGEHKKVLQEITVGSNDPVDVQSTVLALQGFAEFAQGRSDDAKAKFIQALKLDSDNVNALLGMSHVALMKQDFSEAEVLVDKALQQKPDNIKGWSIKGELNHLQGKYPEALAAFQQALELQPDNVILRLKQAETHIAQGELDKAMADVSVVRKAQPDYPPANYLHGQILFQKQDFLAAQEALQQVIRFDPDHLPSQLLLGAISYEQGNLAQAQNYLSRFVIAQPNYLPARKLLAATEIRLKNPYRAVEVLNDVLVQAPADAQLFALLGSAYLQNRDYAEGAKYLQKAVEIAPDNSAFRTQLALSHLATGETDQAVTQLEGTIDLGQGLAQADMLLVLTHLKQRNYDKAIDVASILVEKLPDNPLPHNLLGIAYMAKGEDAQARREFEQALSLQSDFSVAAINLAQLDLKANNREAAETRYRQILERNEGHLDALIALASLAQQAGRYDEVLNWLERAWEYNPTALKAGLPLAQHYLAHNDNLKALRVAQELDSAHSDNPMVMRVLGLTLLANGEHTSALRNFRKLVGLQPQSVEAWHLLATTQLRMKDYQGAATSLDKALAIQDNYLPSLVNKTELQLVDGHFKKALESTLKIQTEYPSIGIGHKLEGDIYLKQKAFADAATAYEIAYDKSPSGQLAMLVANARRLAGDDITHADTQLIDWLKSHPEDKRTRLYLAELYFQESKNKAAIEQYEFLLKREPKNVVVLNNLADLYQREGDSRALDLAEQAYQLKSDNPAIADTLGWILVKRGNIARGLELLQQATALAPEDPRIGYHYAMALIESGDKIKGREQIEQLLTSGKEFPEIEEIKALLEQL